MCLLRPCIMGFLESLMVELLCNTLPYQQDIVRFGPLSPPKSRASTLVPLTGLFLAATHGPKTRLTSQGEHALIRPWLWTLASDVGSYINNNILGYGYIVRPKDIEFNCLAKLKIGGIHVLLGPVWHHDPRQCHFLDVFLVWFGSQTQQSWVLLPSQTQQLLAEEATLPATTFYQKHNRRIPPGHYNAVHSENSQWLQCHP